MKRSESRTGKAVPMLTVWMLLLLVLTVLFRLLYARTGMGALLSLYITCLTVFYHFAMRLAVGEGVTLAFCRRPFRYDAAWYRLRPWEERFYRRIGIHRWKTRLITAKPEQFDLRQRSYEELLHNMTQAEVVHEVIMVLSFVPVLFSRVYGELSVFVVTSVAACLVDSLFVMIQRYNRPRLLAVKRKLEKRNAGRKRM